MQHRKVGPRGKALVQEFENCKLQAYKDGGGVWTIGWGHTGGVKEGDTCTQAQADAWLEEDLQEAADAVQLYVRDPLLPQRQFDACVSFVFNLGAKAFRTSTLLRYLNSRDLAGVAREWLKWKYDNGKEVAGLLRRRKEELQLFQGPEPKGEV